MPRYYFHVEDSRTVIDRVGTELPNLDAAHKEAVTAAGEILRDGAAETLRNGEPWRMWVTLSPAPSEKPLFILRFSATAEK
jgi:hypothetical protein